MASTTTAATSGLNTKHRDSLVSGILCGLLIPIMVLVVGIVMAAVILWRKKRQNIPPRDSTLQATESNRNKEQRYGNGPGTSSSSDTFNLRENDAYNLMSFGLSASCNDYVLPGVNVYDYISTPDTCESHLYESVASFRSDWFAVNDHK